MKVVYTPTAARQIENQLSHLVSKGARRAAVEARKRITSFIAGFLARYPRTGRLIADRQIYEIWIPRTRYVIFYRIEPGDALRILALFHTSQDRSEFEADDDAE